MGALNIAVVLLTLALAAANGANDVSKGVATLAGAGVARYWTAILWGTGTTLIGAIASSVFAEHLSALFARGIIATPPTPAFALAVLVGAAGWVALATAMRVPVSTTCAIVGGLIGAGVEFAPGAVNWALVLTNVAGPLLLSVAVAYLASASLSWMRFGCAQCVCVDIQGRLLRWCLAATSAPSLAVWYCPS